MQQGPLYLSGPEAVGQQVPIVTNLQPQAETYKLIRTDRCLFNYFFFQAFKLGLTSMTVHVCISVCVCYVLHSAVSLSDKQLSGLLESAAVLP